MFSKKFVSAGKGYSTFTEMVPAPYMRRTFEISNSVLSANIVICGLGFYEFYLNGERLTKGNMAPYISNPDDLLYYDAYDISNKLRQGKNVFAFILGNGMLNNPGGKIWDFDTAVYRSSPKLAFSFEAKYVDGTEQYFEADEQVLCTASPICFDDYRIGEFYDARNEIDGWNLPDFDDSGWTNAIAAETPRGSCRICSAEPITVAREIHPVSVRRGCLGETPDFREVLPEICPIGVEAEREGWLYDFGVNTSGVCRLMIHGRKGQKIVLQFCEELDDEGHVDLRAMTFLPQALNHRMIYICKGSEESYTPYFTYFGFRYVLVLGIENDQATNELLTCLEMHSDVEAIGGFSCSDETLNSLYKAACISDLANFYYFPNDCPHREKNGWTADAALSAEHMLVNYRVENSYREWMRNICAAQRIDGALPGIIPTSGWGFEWGNGPAWDCVLVYLPYFVWRYRGETEIIRESAASIMRYLHYITTRRDADGLIHIGLGDWCHVNRKPEDPKAPLCVTDTIICMDITCKAEMLFDAIGMKAQAVFAESVHNEFREAARKHLIDFNTMTVNGRCQILQAMGIFYDLFDENEKPEAFRVLIQLIEECDELMDCGVLGGRILFRLLSQYGRTDLAYRMITTKRFPSYGNWIERGATSLWEMFEPVGASPASHNHHFWGDISGWMIESIGGIRINPDNTNPDHIVIQPRFIDALEHASAETAVPAGKITAAWEKHEEGIELDLCVPEGCTGKIIMENGYLFSDGAIEKAVRSGKHRIIKQ